MNTPFDKMFDFNHDGKLDCFERAARDGLIMKIDNDLRNNDKLFDAGIKPDEFNEIKLYDKVKIKSKNIIGFVVNVHKNNRYDVEKEGNEGPVFWDIEESDLEIV